MDSQDIQVDDLKKLFEIALRTTYKVKDSDTKVVYSVSCCSS